MLIVAHRGDTDQFPEDTLEAILAAAQLGADGIEFDVHQSADGTWWVIHDPTLDRTTSGTGSIASLHDVAIGGVEIDGGLGYDSLRHTGIDVARLAEVLDALSGFPGRLYVDLQHATDADAAELAATIIGRRATVLCRSIADARAVKAVDPHLGTLIRFNQAAIDASLDGWLAEAYGEATVGAVRDAGLPVSTYVDEARYGEDEGNIIRRAWSAGVEAFLSKHPRAAMLVVASLANH
jgi:glycerophosphoryl diester phosphodiesterase